MSLDRVRAIGWTGAARGLGHIHPDIAARLAAHVWFTPALWGRPVRGAVPDGACATRYPFRGRGLSGFEIGAGDRTVLLVHGWAGSSHQYRRLAHAIARQGIRVVVPDLPGHGVDTGRETDLYEMAEAIREIGSGVGPIDVFVAHSLGVAAAAGAFTAGLDVGAFIAVAPGVHPEHAYRQFVDTVGLDAKTAAALRRRIEDRFGVDILDQMRSEIMEAPCPAATTIVGASDDGMVPVSHRNDLASAWHARWVEVDGHGHNGILRSDELRDLVLSSVSHTSEGSHAVRSYGNTPSRS